MKAFIGIIKTGKKVYHLYQNRIFVLSTHYGQCPSPIEHENRFYRYHQNWVD